MSKSEQPSPKYPPLSVLHDAATGRLLAVNMGWVRTIHETESGGGKFTFLNGESETVQEDFLAIVAAVSPEDMVTVTPRKRS